MNCLRKLCWVLGIVFVCIENEVNGQEAANVATVSMKNVESAPGKEAKLSCSTGSSGNSENEADGDVGKLRYCVWERIEERRGSGQAFIVNFNEINSQPGLYSGTRGYSYTGEGFREGECGVKISFVKREDFAKWQCTLITDEKIYRGYVTLEKEKQRATTPRSYQRNGNKTVALAAHRTAIDDNRERPIITSYHDARAIIQPEIVVQSATGESGPVGARLVQEVKVESGGLEIKPRRQGKLIVFE